MKPNEPVVEAPHMDAYGVAEAVASGTWSGLPWAWAIDRLVANRNYWVVTVGPDLQPHALPVWGVWDRVVNEFGFSCGPSSRKLRNLMANPKVTIASDSTVECISIQGTARVLSPDDPTFEGWIERYVQKYHNDAPENLADFIRSNTVVAVTPAVAFGIIERENEFATRATRWRFSDVG